MSMLTPPGMGGKYRITGDRYPRMRRPSNRRRIISIAVASVAALGVAGWGTVQLIDVFTGDDASGAASSTQAKDKGGCGAAGDGRSSHRALPKPAEITVNVYNATPRTGLAQDTADALEKRGFTIGKVGNASASYDKKVKGAAVLLGAPDAAHGAFDVLGARVNGAQPKKDHRKGDDVDLIIGSGFKKLTAEKDAVSSLSAHHGGDASPSAGATC